MIDLSNQSKKLGNKDEKERECAKTDSTYKQTVTRILSPKMKNKQTNKHLHNSNTR